MSTYKLITFIAAIVLALPLSAQTDRREVRSGNRMFSKEKYREAEVDYRKAFIKDTLSLAANYNLASTLYREGNYDEAAKSLERIGENAAASDHAADYHYNSGDVALQKKDYASAVEAFRQALLLNPSDMDAKENYVYARKMMENNDNQGGGGDNQDNKQDQDKDQNQDQNQNQDRNQDNNQDQDNSQDQNQDNNRNQNQDQDQNQNRMSSQQARQMLKAVQAQEQKTQDKVNKEKAAVLKSRQKEKNW